MYTFLIVIFVLICILMTFVILIQSSKGGGLAGTFGGGMDAMGGSMFGGRGAGNFLTKLTTGFAAAFMILALVLGLMTRGEMSDQSLIERERQNRMEAPSRVLPQAPDPAQQNPGSVPPPQPEQNQ